MPGSFEGLTDTQWRILQPLLQQSPSKNLKRKPHTPCRKICDRLFWILITGSRWWIFLEDRIGDQDLLLIGG
ncbi:putative transposase [Neochlamydia sp. EPS4]|uniref:transposase n=1 Tax=Neochlamydia sp. EPS4 TaxID=1478175 RepID=UPI00058370FA|nr:putative transposase [Neochlamydia sp. EPS4]